MVTSVDRLLIIGRDKDRTTAGLDKEGGDIGHDEEQDDASGWDEEIAVRLEVAGETAKEDIVGSDERAGGKYDEEVLGDVDALALGLGVKTKTTADTDGETVCTNGHRAHPFGAILEHEECLRESSDSDKGWRRLAINITACVW
jgi:hypothetical protein